mmetsp:Transcript_44527/g.139669  ORF Transcript_44527/g.139669 Transcript_44527/m.139669 type:complete len:253 (+) Transcript_44527:456-1214(+)
MGVTLSRNSTRCVSVSRSIKTFAASDFGANCIWSSSVIVAPTVVLFTRRRQVVCVLATESAPPACTPVSPCFFSMKSSGGTLCVRYSIAASEGLSCRVMGLFTSARGHAIRTPSKGLREARFRAAISASVPSWVPVSQGRETIGSSLYTMLRSASSAARRAASASAASRSASSLARISSCPLLRNAFLLSGDVQINQRSPQPSDWSKTRRNSSSGYASSAPFTSKKSHMKPSLLTSSRISSLLKTLNGTQSL